MSEILSKPVNPLIPGRRPVTTLNPVSHEPDRNLPPLPGSEAPVLQESNTGPTSPSNSPSEGWPFPGAENVSRAPQSIPEAIPVALPSLPPEAPAEPARAFIDLTATAPAVPLEPIARTEAGPARLQRIDRTPPGTPALVPVPRALPQGVAPLQPLNQVAAEVAAAIPAAVPAQVIPEPYVPSIDSTADSTEELAGYVDNQVAVASSQSETPPETIELQENGFPKLIPIGDASQPVLAPGTLPEGTVVPPLTPIRQGPAGGPDIPQLQAVARDIFGYIVTGVSEDSSLVDIHGIFLRDKLNVLLGVSLYEKFKILCEAKYQELVSTDPVLVSRFTEKALSLASATPTNPSLTEEVVFQAYIQDRGFTESELERDEIPRDAGDPYTIYTFRVVKVKLNDMAAGLRLATIAT